MLRLVSITVAAVCAVAVVLVSPAAAQENLMAGMKSGSEGGAEFGLGEGGYRVLFPYFESGPPRLHIRIVPLPASFSLGDTTTLSLKFRLFTGFTGDAGLLFGASDRGYYYVVISQHFDQVQWSLGHRQVAGSKTQPLAGGTSDALNYLEDGEEIVVDIKRRTGDKPLINLRINGGQMAEVPALHGEDDPFSPIGDVGILCAAYSNLGTPGYVFNSLFATSQ